MPAYLVQGHRIDAADEGFGAALASAYAARHRPLCLCTDSGAEPAEMYIARTGGGFAVKRMPFTGGRHAPNCPSYEPPEGWSGLGHLMGSAINEDPHTGITSLKLGFAMSKTGPRTIEPGSGEEADSVGSDGTRLTLRALLHYLWDEAELTRWQPGFEGKRTWGSVRHHLLQAADGKEARGQALRGRLYIPEPFSVEQRDAINARRRAQWARGTQPSRGVKPLMLLIGEVKEIVPARYGYKAVIKHVPDQAFAMDDGLFRRMERRLDRELSLWGAADDLRMVIGATFGLTGASVPAIDSLTLMPTTLQWLPVEDAAEKELVERLVREGRVPRGMRSGGPRSRAS